MSIRTAMLGRGASGVLGASLLLYTVPAGFHVRVWGGTAQSFGVNGVVQLYALSPGGDFAVLIVGTPAAVGVPLKMADEIALEAGDTIHCAGALGTNCLAWASGTVYSN